MDAPKNSRKTGVYWILGFLIVVLVALRMALPSIVLHFLNGKLEHLPGHKGHIEDISMSLWRGSYQIHRLNIKKINNDKLEPLLFIREIDIAVEWPALLHGKIRSQIVVTRPVVNFIRTGKEETSQTRVDTKSSKEVVDIFVPITINKFVVENGEIHFRDMTTDPKVDLYIKDFAAQTSNLTNVEKVSKKLYSRWDFSGTLLGNGKMKAHADVASLEKPPAFYFSFELKDAQLQMLNDFFRAYAKFDFEKGRLNVFSELASDDKKIKGYVKPLLEDVEIVNFAKDAREQGFWLAVWEAIVGASAQIIKNHQFDRIGTKVDVEGSYENPQTDTWEIVVSLLRNGFVQALQKDIEGSISLKDVQNGESKKTAK